MKARLDAAETAPAAYKAMYGLEVALRASSKLEPTLTELVRMRVSQINGCAFCIDMHAKDARAQGETEERLYALSAWEETPFYSERERAALAWAEAVTVLTDGHVSDAAYVAAKQQFSEEELVNLTWAAIAINGWNRLSIAFRAVAGEYQAGVHKTGGSRQ